MNTPTAADFLAFRFRHNGPADHIEIRTFKPDGFPGPRSWHLDPTAAAEEAATLPEGLNVFYGVTARLNEGGKKEHITGCPGVWQDLDFGRYEDGEAGAWAALASFPLAPTTVTHTGGGLQATWEFVAPLTNRQLFPAFEDLLSRHARLLNSDPAVAEVARVMRLPGSHNNKKKYGTPRPVTIVRFNPERLYTLHDFERVLPAPPEAARPQTAYPRGNHRTGDTPSVDDVAEMLRHVDPQPGYKEWLTILAAIHSAYPGPDGEALAEAWSGHVSKPGEIAEKFKSFGNYQGTRGNATIGTVIHAAKLGGYRPRTEGQGRVPTLPDTDLIATLRADVARLGDELRAARAENDRLTRRLTCADEEGERMVLRITELETENAALEAAIKHPSQAAGVGALDLVEEACRAYGKSDVLTRDGKDYARVTYAAAANRRSAKTLATGLAVLSEAGTVDVFKREETYRLPNGKERKQEIAYIHLMPEWRDTRGKAVLGILQTPPEEKKHGGRRVIPVPPAVAQQDHPVKRTRQYVTLWQDALTDQPITTQTEYLGKDFWTARGEQLLPEEITRQRVAEGHEPPHAPTAQRPLVLHRGGGRQDADIVTRGTSRQDADPPRETPPGSCADAECTARVEVGGYCARHFAEHRQRHQAVYGDFAATGD